jgi:TRAP-type C4-dicarboxylate transport system permease small subunit
MMVWMIFAGSVLVSKRDIHINVNALEEMVPKTVKPLKVIQRVITAIYASMVMYFGVQVLRIAAFQTSPNMKIRMNIIYSIYPIAMAFILLFTLYHLFKSFKKKEEKR